MATASENTHTALCAEGRISPRTNNPSADDDSAQRCSYTGDDSDFGSDAVFRRELQANSFSHYDGGDCALDEVPTAGWDVDSIRSDCIINSGLGHRSHTDDDNIKWMDDELGVAGGCGKYMDGTCTTHAGVGRSCTDVDGGDNGATSVLSSPLSTDTCQDIGTSPLIRVSRVGCGRSSVDSGITASRCTDGVVAAKNARYHESTTNYGDTNNYTQQQQMSNEVLQLRGGAVNDTLPNDDESHQCAVELNEQEPIEDDDHDDLPDRLLPCQISERQLLIAMFNTSRNMPVENYALWEDLPYKEFQPTPVQQEHIALFEAHHNHPCEDCLWQDSHRLYRKKTWRPVSKEDLATANKITPLDVFDGNVYYINNHGELGWMKSIKGHPGVTFPKLSTAQPDKRTEYVYSAMSNVKHAPSNAENDPTDAENDPTVNAESVKSWTISRALLVLLTFYDVPKDFDYPKWIADHINELRYDNHGINLSALRQGINTIVRTELPITNNSGYVGFGESRNGDKWWWSPYRGQLGSFSMVDTMAEAAVERLRSEVEGGMYDEYNSRHILHILSYRPGFSSLFFDRDGRNLIRKWFIKRQALEVGDEHQNSGNNNDGDNDDHNVGDDLTPHQGSTRQPKKVTPSPGQYVRRHLMNEFTNDCIANPNMVSNTAQEVMAFCGNLVTCERCSRSYAVPEDELPGPEAVVKLYCETCRDAVTQFMSNSDGRSLERSVIHGLSSDRTGKLPPEYPCNDYRNNIHDCMSFVHGLSQGDQENSLCEDFVISEGHTVDEMILHETDGYTVYHGHSTGDYLDWVNQEGSYAGGPELSMGAWYYNVSTNLWKRTSYGFKRLKLYKAEDEDGTIDVVLRDVSLNDGCNALDFDIPLDSDRGSRETAVGDRGVGDNGRGDGRGGDGEGSRRRNEEDSQSQSGRDLDSDATGGDTVEQRASANPRTLANLGDTCYMNAAIQCLVHTVPFRDYMLSGRFMNDLNRRNNLGSKGELIKEFAKLLYELCFSSETCIAPRSFKAKLGDFIPEFSGFAQHDSQEVLHAMLQMFHEDTLRLEQRPTSVDDPMQRDGEPIEELSERSWKAYREREDSRMVDLFYGQLKQRSVCSACERSSIKFDHTNVYSLPIPKGSDPSSTGSPSDLESTDIYECIRLFQDEENRMEGVDSVYCRNCKENKPAVRTMEIYSPPPILFLHIKRFKRIRALEYHRISTEVTMPLDGLEICGFQYECYAVITHHPGLCNGDVEVGIARGHYTATVKCSNGVWKKMNDANAPVDVNESDVITDGAYVVLLKRSDEQWDSNPAAVLESDASWRDMLDRPEGERTQAMNRRRRRVDDSSTIQKSKRRVLQTKQANKEALAAVMQNLSGGVRGREIARGHSGRKRKTCSPDLVALYEVSPYILTEYNSVEYASKDLNIMDSTIREMINHNRMYRNKTEDESLQYDFRDLNDTRTSRRWLRDLLTVQHSDFNDCNTLTEARGHPSWYIHLAEAHYRLAMGRRILKFLRKNRERNREIEITIMSDGHDDYTCKMQIGELFGATFDRYAKKIGVARSLITFLYQARNLDSNQTPRSIRMNGDYPIIAIIESTEDGNKGERILREIRNRQRKRHGGRRVCSRNGAKRKPCCFEGCTNQSVRGGVCGRHGGRPICSFEGCTLIAQTGAVCSRHGGKDLWRKTCSFEGCTLIAQIGGVCGKHGGKPLCSSEGCTTIAQRGGLCWKHGAKSKTCSFEGCTNQSSAGGVCGRHGGRPTCSFEGCTSIAVRGGVCGRHGGRPRCSSEGCTSIAHKGGLCVRHGGRPICSFEGCTTISRNRGVCGKHGAKSKTCSFEGCTNQSRIGGVCWRHEGRRHGARTHRKRKNPPEPLSPESQGKATLALQAAIQSAADDADGKVDPAKFKAALDSGYSMHFVRDKVATHLETLDEDEEEKDEEEKDEEDED